MSGLMKWYCTKLYPTNADEDFGIAGDFAVYKAERERKRRRLEEHKRKFPFLYGKRIKDQ